ncbi:MAG: nitroreductase family protein [Promethearchaeia archaeon]
MDFYEVVKKRRSYRFYKPDVIPEKDKVERILNAARLAPTWANMQGVHYIVVQKPEKVKMIWKAIDQKDKFSNAPIFIVGIIKEIASGINKAGIKYYNLDFGICFEHLILAATAEGMATCWVGIFDEEKIKDILEIPKKYRVLGITPLGYTIKEKGEISDRLSLEEIVHYDKY